MSFNSETRESARWLGEQFVTGLGQALEGMTGESFEVTSALAEREDYPSAEALWWDQPVSFPPNGRLVIGADATAWTAIGTRVLEAAGLDVEPAAIRSTFLEVAGQALSATAQSLSTTFKRDVACVNGREASPDPDFLVGALKVQVKHASGFEAALLFSIPKAILIALNVKDEPKELPPAPRQEPQTPAVSSSSQPRTLDLLLDVELPVSVSFGRADLTLKDVLKLTSGSIVELNRSITEPVEIIVNNCVIARGEVVVVDGNYGVRINQIITRQERLRTLK